MTDLQTGVNVLGGTPVKPGSERMTQSSQLHRDTEGMMPEVDPKIEKVAAAAAGGKSRNLQDGSSM